MSNIVYVTSFTIDEIKKSISLGYNIPEIGLIGRTRQGVILCNDKQEVRGTYDLSLLNVIKSLIAEYFINNKFVTDSHSFLQ